MKIALLGDTALFGRNTVENTSYKKRFEPIKNYLEQCDYIVANLESPLTTQTKTIGGKSAYLKGSPKNVKILKYLGITHVTLANNHIFDYRAQGIEDTIKVLEDNKIEWFGANDKSVTISDNTNSVVLMGFCCYSTNGKGFREKKPFVNILDPAKIEKQIAEKENSMKLPILSIHWGQEHVHYPNYDHLELARKLCNGRTMIIHGHHPHVIQGIEEMEDSLISYSLGNFCFDDVYTSKSKEPLIKLSRVNQESFILIVELVENKIINYEIITFSFVNGIYKIDRSIQNKIDAWSRFLELPKKEYTYKRKQELTEYIKKRKELRNIEWYLKRLNIESARIILSSWNNLKAYNRHIKKYIQ